MMQAIETIYNGYRFRSRLEARWAIFFDEMKITYHYEIEGFVFGNIKYLPDFYLPEHKLWLEIKPDTPSKDELEKARLLKSNASEGIEVGILYGEPWVTPDPDSSISIQDTHYCLLLLNSWFGGEDINCLFSQCRRCNKLLFDETISSHCENGRFADGNVGYGCCDRMGITFSDKLENAYTAARQARFEHGEKPR